MVQLAGRSRVVALVTALAIGALAGCGGSDDQVASGRTEDPGGGGAKIEVEVEVEVTKLTDVAPLAETVASGPALLSTGFLWSPSPYYWSEDRGLSWNPSKLPDGDRPEGQRLVTVADRSFVLGHTDGYALNPGRPTIWVSEDGGRTFDLATGVTDGLDGGDVGAIVETNGRLVAIGRAASGGQTRAARWESTDGGYGWAHSETTGLAVPFDSDSVAAGSRGAIVATARRRAGLGQGSRQLVRSTDQGQSWTSVELREGRESISRIDEVDGLLVAESTAHTWTSGDGGRSWKRLADAPIIRDKYGTQPDPTLQIGVHPVKADGDLMLARYSALYNPDHNLARLLWSNDRGSSWHAADLGVECLGTEASSTLSAPVRTGATLVVTWNCIGEGLAGGRLLMSTDDGHTWQPQPSPAVDRLELGAPVLAPDGQVVVLASKNFEQSVDLVVHVTVGR